MRGSGQEGGDARRFPLLYAADLTGCAALRPFAPDETVTLFAQALEREGATVVSRVSHIFPGGGITCALVLSESHAVLHTWPESGTATIDIFSCSARLDGPAAIERMGRALGAENLTVKEILRADGFLPRLAPHG